MAEHNRILPRGSLYIWQDGVLFVGTDMVNEVHRHFTASVSIALTGSFRVQTGRGVEPKAFRGLMVAPNTEQNMDARGSRVLILQVDPESRDHARIAARFERYGPIHPMDDELYGVLRDESARRVEEPDFSPTDLWNWIIDQLAVSDAPPRRVDPRIGEALAIIKSDFLSRRPPSSHVASAFRRVA